MAIRVLVVDESLFMRTLISDLLNADPEIRVCGTARSGSEAVSKIQKLKPDCVTLDLNMPGMDGLTALRRIMRECPTPVVIVSAAAQERARLTLECLSAGAVAAVPKPSGELSLDIHSIQAQLIAEVKAASGVEMRKVRALLAPPARRAPSKPKCAAGLIAIGASTGGPQTLPLILNALPADLPVPVLVAQHMSDRLFSESFADRLNHTCPLKVKVAQEGAPLVPGTVILAPAGSRLTLRAVPQPSSDSTHRVRVHLEEAPHGELTPSIDTIFSSVADRFGKGAVGVILSGMGRDGLQGMRAIRQAGGRTIAQDESALIFGMPRAVIEAGLADEILPASEIAEVLFKSATGGREAV